MRPGLPEEISLAAAVAVIDEQRCIGCTLCIHACPVDAIVGAAKLMHSVLSDACTGCELCIQPCPVDCISMVAVVRPERAALGAATADARRRCAARNLRLERAEMQKARKLAARRAVALEDKKRETIQRALDRARQRLASRDL
jgi:electron transport complex protein RnfB